MLMRPFSRFSFFTEKSGAGPDFDDSLFPDPVARVAKFHLPSALRIRLTSGLPMVRPFTLSAFEVISGHISTPTLNDLAVRKGDLLKLGSSAMERSSAESAPEKIDRLRFPT